MNLFTAIIIGFIIFGLGYGIGLGTGKIADTFTSKELNNCIDKFNTLLDNVNEFNKLENCNNFDLKNFSLSWSVIND